MSSKRRQFIKNPTKKYITEETKNLIDRLLLVDVGLDKATIKLEYNHRQTEVKFGSQKIRL